MLNFLQTGNQIGFGDWPAWIALAAAMFSPVVTIVIDKVYQYKVKKMELEAQRKEALAQLISDIVHAPAGGINVKPKLSATGAKALAYCSDKTVAAVMRYFSIWPTTQHAQDIMHEPMYIFERPNGETGYQRDNVQTATEKLIVTIKYESANSKAPK